MIGWVPCARMPRSHRWKHLQCPGVSVLLLPPHPPFEVDDRQMHALEQGLGQSPIRRQARACVLVGIAKLHINIVFRSDRKNQFLRGKDEPRQLRLRVVQLTEASTMRL